MPTEDAPFNLSLISLLRSSKGLPAAVSGSSSVGSASFSFLPFEGVEMPLAILWNASKVGNLSSTFCAESQSLSDRSTSGVLPLESSLRFDAFSEIILFNAQYISSTEVYDKFFVSIFVFF